MRGFRKRKAREAERHGLSQDLGLSLKEMWLCHFPCSPRGTGAARRRPWGSQNMRLGNCMLRMRLKWRFTAAAFLRLRSAVGFS